MSQSQQSSFDRAPDPADAGAGPRPQRDPSLSWLPLLGSAAIACLLLVLVIALNLAS